MPKGPDRRTCAQCEALFIEYAEAILEKSRLLRTETEALVLGGRHLQEVQAELDAAEARCDNTRQALDYHQMTAHRARVQSAAGSSFVA